MHHGEALRLRKRPSPRWPWAAVVIAVLLNPAPSFAASVTLAWNPNTERDLKGYTIHYGRSSRAYDLKHVYVGNVTSWTVNNLADGATYYFAVTARDRSNNESGYSNEVAFPEKVPKAPAPTGPGRGRTGLVYGYTTGNAAFSSLGDRLEYRFRWGDGTASPWIDPTQVDAVEAWKSWPRAGIYNVVAEARCTLHPTTRLLSAGKTVSVLGGGSLRLDDSFSDGSAAGDPQWRVLSGSWTVGTGKTFDAVSQTETNVAVVKALPSFKAGRLSTLLSLTPEAPAANVGIVFALRDLQHYRYVLLNDSEITLGQAGATPRESAGVKASQIMAFDAAQWHQIRVDMYPGGRVLVFVGSDTVPLLTYRFADAIAGSFGCYAEGSGAAFDDFRAWDERALP